jgi:hypothetical protein
VITKKFWFTAVKAFCCGRAEAQPGKSGKLLLEVIEVQSELIWRRRYYSFSG